MAGMGSVNASLSPIVQSEARALDVVEVSLCAHGEEFTPKAGLVLSISDTTAGHVDALLIGRLWGGASWCRRCYI